MFFRAKLSVMLRELSTLSVAWLTNHACTTYVIYSTYFVDIVTSEC